MDIARNQILKKCKDEKKAKLIVKCLAFIGYLQSLFFMGVLTWACIKMMGVSIQYTSYTEGVPIIPTWWLYSAICFGCVLSIITIIFITLTLFTESDEYMIN